MADVLVMNKLDTVTPDLVADFQSWANDLYPPKLLIAATTHGRIDPAWLDLASGGREPPVAEQGLRGFAKQQGAHAPAHAPRPPAKGWIFSPDEIFDDDRLLALLGSHPGITRAKGVFRVVDDWIAINRVGKDLTVSPTAYRRDSRVEVFADAIDWDEFERELLGCRLSG
jgi:G3E family GTPase